jgi:hypothetical protein
MTWADRYLKYTSTFQLEILGSVELALFLVEAANIGVYRYFTALNTAMLLGSWKANSFPQDYGAHISNICCHYEQLCDNFEANNRYFTKNLGYLNCLI